MVRSILMATLLGVAPAPPAERPRLVVLTDISSLTAGEAEPDDGQSLIRLMLYTNEFDIEGLVASSNLGHGQKVRPELIRRVVDAYDKVRPNLLLHDDRYPPAEGLRGGIKAGQPVAGPKVPVAESVGEGKDTEASDWIIRVVDRPDPRPVWVVIWGGSADLAQALWKVRATRSPDELARFVAKLRVHAIGDQDSTGPWIRDAVPRAVHDHPAAGLPGDVPGRRHRPGLVRVGEGEHPRPRAARRPLPGLSRRRHLVLDAGPGAGDQGGGHAVVPLAGPQRPGRRGASPAGELGRAVRGGRREIDRRAGHGPRHLGRPRPPDVVGLPLAAGVPGRLRRPARLVRQALCRGQPPAGRADRRGPGAGGQGWRRGDPRRRGHDRPGRRRGWTSPGESTRRPRRSPARSSSRAGTRGTRRSWSPRSWRARPSRSC